MDGRGGLPLVDGAIERAPAGDCNKFRDRHDKPGDGSDNSDDLVRVWHGRLSIGRSGAAQRL